tara:strand:- start:338 stop:1171 length:834 start_codon:yes stop_codon:yes gene_type:complete
MIKKFYFLLLILSLFVHVEAQPKETAQAQPTGLFSCIFWGKPTTRSVMYAPWGNFEEQNATQSLVRVAYGSLSRKCAYYGHGNIKFYQRRNYTELELDLMEDKSEADKSIFFSELSFITNEDETKEFIILFSPTKDLKSYRTFLLPFDQKEIPWGSYKLFSQFNETLYVAVGNKKFSLEPGKSMVLHSKDFDGSSRERMIIYRKEKGKYVESASQSFGINDRQRGIFFVTVKKGKAQVVPMVESNRPIEQAIGYNSRPRKIEGEEGEIKSLVPVGNI